MFKLKIYYEDTDAGGVVYHANYLKFLERARTQLLLEGGFTHNILREKFNIITVVKSCEIDFIKPVILDSELEISTFLIKKSKIQFFLEQKIYCNNVIVVKAKVRIVTINIKGKISRMPWDLFNIF
jgi:acyl-CoA thioester hydrolase|tara:strand:+ start:813 stop:1190 length:378 start_codon:yes stop_codon:yes gene_type:complete